MDADEPTDRSPDTDDDEVSPRHAIGNRERDQPFAEEPGSLEGAVGDDDDREVTGTT